MLIGMSWMKFHLVVLVLYVSINIIFALAYYLVGVEHLAGIFPKSNWEDFLECFFFSTQAFTTVGYGRISPEGYGANIIAAIESMSGLLGFALATGLLYGRFAKPKAKLMYSNKAVIGKIDNQLALMFRVANQRSSQIIEVEAQTIFAYLEIVNEKPKRLFKELELQLSKINVLTLGWTIVHFLNESSPLYNLTTLEIKKLSPEIMVLIKGFDELYSQTLYSRHSYIFEEIEFDSKFESIIKIDDDGNTILELNKMNNIIKL